MEKGLWTIVKEGATKIVVRVWSILKAVIMQLICVGKAAHYWTVKLVPRLRRSYVCKTLAWEAQEAGVSYREYEARLQGMLERRHTPITIEEYCFSKWKF